MKSANIEQPTEMSQKNPVKKLVHLKVIVNNDQDGKEARREVGDDIDELRPRIRADCLPGGINEMRPCPWYGCKYHLGLSINEDTGSLSVRDIDEMVHTCDIDVAEIGGVPGSGRGMGISLEEAGEIMDLTRERMRQIEAKGLVLIKPLAAARGLAPDDYGRPSVIRRQKSSIVSEPQDDDTPTEQENPLASDSEEP